MSTHIFMLCALIASGTVLGSTASDVPIKAMRLFGREATGLSNAETSVILAKDALPASATRRHASQTHDLLAATYTQTGNRGRSTPETKKKSSAPNSQGKSNNDSSTPHQTNHPRVAKHEPRPQTSRNTAPETDDLDAALLEDLDDELSDELMEELEELQPDRSDRSALEDKRDGDAGTKAVTPDSLEQQLGEGAETTDSQHPLARISNEMQRAEMLIRQQNTGDQTRALQEKIVSELDKLIREAQQRSKSSSARQQARQQGSRRDRVRQPNQQPAPGNTAGQQAARDSQNRVGQEKAVRPDPKAMKKLMEELWGHLPERLRQQVINASVEEFLPKYELELEQYFRRLAEELRDAP